MYFPPLVRRANYKQKGNGKLYADYKIHYTDIAEDCKHRCVYCDVLVDEVGGEGMHLDHFKPQKHFPELELAAENLVLSCARCNQLKSHWWPEKTGHSNGGLHGFIDPFIKDKHQYFEVNAVGEIVGKLPPSNYVIELLCLNRVTRANIRRKRALKIRALAIIDRILNEMTELEKLPSDSIKEKLPRLIGALREAKALI